MAKSKQRTANGEELIAKSDEPRVGGLMSDSLVLPSGTGCRARESSPYVMRSEGR